jgi:MFS family permease
MLLGPLLGGYLSMAMGIRSIFIVIGILLLIAFFASLFFVQEEFVPSDKPAPSFGEIWRLLPQPQITVAMFVTTMVMQLGLMSIQPIITVYISQLSESTTHIALISGMVFSASGLASIIAAPRLGNLADRIGPQKVMLVALTAAALLFIPQAMVDSPWQLMVLRFLLGIATAGLLPSINSLVKQLTPDEIAGRVFGYNQSAQFIGSFGGALLGGQVAAWFGIQYVFYFTSALLMLNAIWVYKMVYAGKLAHCPWTQE